MQGEVFKRIRSRVYEKKRDQRELIKVAQRNFRKYLAMRDWGWFTIIQKTRGLIGLPNPEEELRLLEEKANATYGEYKAALDTTASLESQLGDLKDEIAAMSKQLLLPCHSCWYFLASKRDLSAERRVETGRSSRQSESRAEYANLEKNEFR